MFTAASLEAVLKGLGLENIVTVALNRMIAGTECDIVLLYGSQKIPFSSIEVKKSSNKCEGAVFSSKGDRGKFAGCVAGQNFDQLCTLELMGYKALVGMITNGNKMMITTTGASMNLPGMKDWENLRQDISPKSTAKQKDFSPEQFSFEYEAGPRSAITKIPRKLTACEPVDSHETDIFLRAFAVFVCLACQRLRQERSGISLANASCRVLNIKCKTPGKQGKDMRCSFRKMSWPKANLDSCINFKNHTLIFLIYHLGVGETGDCCLALNYSGTGCCVVKFFVRLDGEGTLKLAEAEFENWRKVYGQDEKLPGCWVGQLPNNDGYLCMPYLKHVRSAQRQGVIENGQVEQALTRFAKSGFQHNDVGWRHLGFLGKNLYLFDLGEISELPKDEAKSWVETTLEDLKRRMSPQPNVSTPEGMSSRVVVDGPVLESAPTVSKRTIISATEATKKRKLKE